MVMVDLFNTILGWYQEPLFWLFPVATSLLSMAVFLLFVLPLTWLPHADLYGRDATRFSRGMTATSVLRLVCVRHNLGRA